MKRVPAKTEQAFLKAYEELSDPLFRHCYFRVSSREVALDLVQEAFLKTWNHVVIGEEIQNFKAFMYRVVNNLIIDHYRKKKSDSLDVLQEDDNFDPPDSESGTHALQKAEIAQMKKSLDALPDNYREVMVMRYLDGLSVGEIANILNETENVISVRIHRATEKAKQIFNP
jgi:RNA polymerase sigma-70 factor (ECF subfamily)